MKKSKEITLSLLTAIGLAATSAGCGGCGSKEVHVHTGEGSKVYEGYSYVGHGGSAGMYQSAYMNGMLTAFVMSSMFNGYGWYGSPYYGGVYRGSSYTRVNNYYGNRRGGRYSSAPRSFRTSAPATRGYASANRAVVSRGGFGATAAGRSSIS